MPDDAVGARRHDPARLRVLPRVGARGLAAAAARARDPLDPRAAAREDDLVRDGDRAGRASRRATSASPTRPSASARTCASPGARTCGCCSCARRGGAAGWRRGCTGSALEEAARQGYETIRLYTPYGAAARPRLLRARGLGAGRPRVPGAAARAGPRRVPSRAVIPERLFEDAAERSRVSMATRWQRVRDDWRMMVQAGVAVALAWAVAKWRAGATTRRSSRPVSAIIALGQSYHERGRRAVELVGRGHARHRGRRPARLQLGTGRRRSSRWRCSSRSGSACSSGPAQLFVNQVAVSAVLVFTVTPPTSGFSFARTLDALTGGVIALAVAAVVLPADPCGSCASAARPVLDELRRRCATSPTRCARATGRGRGGAGAGARDRRARRALLRRHPREPLDRPHLAHAQARAGHGRVLRRGRGADRPRGPQRARARPRRDAGAGAGRERPAGGRRRARGPRARGARAGGRAGDRRGLRRRPRAGAARRRDRHPGARGHDEPVASA